jgi:hypothetical protein
MSLWIQRCSLIKISLVWILCCIKIIICFIHSFLTQRRWYQIVVKVRWYFILVLVLIKMMTYGFLNLNLVIFLSFQTFLLKILLSVSITISLLIWVNSPYFPFFYSTFFLFILFCLFNHWKLVILVFRRNDSKSSLMGSFRFIAKKTAHTHLLEESHVFERNTRAASILTLRI